MSIFVIFKKIRYSLSQVKRSLGDDVSKLQAKHSFSAQKGTCKNIFIKYQEFSQEELNQY